MGRYIKTIKGRGYYYDQYYVDGVQVTKYVGPVKRKRTGVLEWLRLQNERGPDDIGAEAMQQAYEAQVAERFEPLAQLGKEILQGALAKSSEPEQPSQNGAGADEQSEQTDSDDEGSHTN